MARIRSIPPDVATDPKLCRVSIAAAQLAIVSWPWHDDHGHIAYEPERIRLWVFPSRPEVDANALIDELLAVGWFRLYEGEDGRKFLFCTEFTTYQKVDKPSKSRFKQESARLVNPRASSRSLASPREGSPSEGMDGREGREGSGKERSGADAPEPSGCVEDEAELPADAVRWLRHFYPASATDPARRRDVAAQLRRSLNGGATLSKGKIVTAGSASRLGAKAREHLEEDARTPMRKRDSAIRVLLLKLADVSDRTEPASGPVVPRADSESPTLRAKAEAEREEQLDVAEAERLVAAWTELHGDELEAISAAALEQIPPAPGPVGHDDLAAPMRRTWIRAEILRRARAAPAHAMAAPGSGAPDGPPGEPDSS